MRKLFEYILIRGIIMTKIGFDKITVPLRVSMGNFTMPLEELLNLDKGMVVESVKKYTEPVSLLVGDTVVADGELICVDDRVSVRVLKIKTGITEI